jgi:hypothetical protein
MINFVHAHKYWMLATHAFRCDIWNDWFLALRRSGLVNDIMGPVRVLLRFAIFVIGWSVLLRKQKSFDRFLIKSGPSSFFARLNLNNRSFKYRGVNNGCTGGETYFNHRKLSD